jgi:hypothetical protein
VRGSLSLSLDGKEISRYHGITVYAPAGDRDLLLPLPVEDAGRLHQGSLDVRFEEEDVKGALAAETRIQLH